MPWASCTELEKSENGLFAGSVFYFAANFATTPEEEEKKKEEEEKWLENNKLHFFSWESSSFVGANRIFRTRLFFHQLFTLRHHFQTDQQIKNALKHTKTH